MSFINLFLSVWLLVGTQRAYGINLHAEEEVIDCKTYRGQGPYINSLNHALPEYVRPSDARVTSIHKHQAIIYLNHQFNCTYNKPIHWVFHLDPDDKTINLDIDFSERIIKRNENKEPRYVYSANFRLLYLISDLREDMLFSCEPIPMLNSCERNFIQIVDRTFYTEPTPVPNESLSELSTALLHSSRRNVVTRYFDQMSCPLILFLKAEDGNVISYRWEVQNLKASLESIDETTVQTNETTHLENLFRFNETHEPHCVRVLKKTEKCLSCRYVGEIINYTMNAVVFRATFENATLLYKGFFSVPRGARSERKFYLDWQIKDSVLENQMMKLLVPEKIYANLTFTVTCRVSVFLFSYGTRITDQDSPDIDESNTKEIFKPDGYREVVRKLLFPEANKVKTVSCFGPLKKSDRWVHKSKAMLVEIATSPLIGNSPENTTEFHVVLDRTESVIAECNVSGNPSPTAKWILPSKLSANDSKRLHVTSEKNFLRIYFPKWEHVFAGTYTCVARNFRGVTTKAFTFQNKVEESDSKLTLILTSSLGGLVILLGTLIGILAWKIRKQRLDFEIQTQKAIEEFKNGIKTDDIPEEVMKDPNFSVLQLPYNEDFEVSLSNWVIADKILGTGQFGIVRYGSVLLKGEKITVAIKSLKSSVEIDEFKSFLFELKVMAYLGHHKNIVSLVAACTEGINNRDIFIGVEFCDNGSLVDYLRKYKANFVSMVGPDGKFLSDLSHASIDSSQYANINMFSTHQLFRWSYHIACGMEYLRVKKVLHGDLAARNVLLTSRKVAKIGDFGLSRVLMNSENYTKQTQTALPWKWMAVESLSMRVFSFESDVWAYGVTLYEIFTLGQSPYPGIGWSPDFITQLQNGMRMAKPVHCETSVYKIMRACWENDPNQRPGYAKIKRKLNKGLQRLSVLILANKEQERKKTTSLVSSTRTQSQCPAFLSIPAEILTVLDIENDAGLYSNLPRRTMNYYKNC